MSPPPTAETADPHDPDVTELDPYVPRFVAEWMADSPGERWRAVDATLAFVDLSGFTKMSERLAVLGKEGAEEVTRVVGETFEALLAHAHRFGGSLLKFGGDALLLLFTGPGHDQRGGAATWAMRAELRDRNPIATSSGEVRLRMSCGLHSGEIHLFLAGKAHRELFVAGPGATAVARAESAADAGQIRLSPEASVALGRWARASLLIRAPDAPQTSYRMPSLPVPAENLLPPMVADVLARGGGEPEHRQVVVAFLSFSGTDEMVMRDADALAGDLDRVVAVCSESASAVGATLLATDVMPDGGKIILAAGAPTSVEGAEERMLTCLRAIADEPGLLPLRMGVHRGHVFAGTVGTERRKTYTVMGDVVNTAARVMAHAPPGELWATPAVVEASATLFDAEPVPPFMAKGKRRPVEVLRIGAARAQRRDRSADHLALVGRDSEVRAVATAVRGHGAITVCGPSGIGKSRVAAAALDVVARPVVAARGRPETAVVSHAVTRTLARTVLGDVPRDEASLGSLVAARLPEAVDSLPLIGGALGIDVEPNAHTRHLAPEAAAAGAARALAALLQAAAPIRAIWFIEDVDDVDAASMAVLDAMVEAGATLVATQGETDEGWSRGDRLLLDVLDRADALRLAEEVAGDRLVPHALAEAARRSGGNPLLLIELVEAMASGSPLDALPDSVEAVIAVAVDRLAPVDRQLLRDVAVLGTTFDRSLADVVLGRRLRVSDDLGRFLDDDGGEVRFRQALFQHVAYEGLTYGRRRRLHRLAGREAIRRGLSPATAAVHFDRAGDFEAAWEQAGPAAAAAEGAHSPVEALQLRQIAARAADQLKLAPPERSQAHLALALAHGMIGQLDEAERETARALRFAEHEPMATSRACFLRARIVATRGRFSLALRWLRRAEEALAGREDDDASRQRAELAVGRASALGYLGRPGEALAVLDAAMPLVASTKDASLIAQAQSDRLLAAGEAGRADVAELAASALEAAMRCPDLSVRANVINAIGHVDQAAGRWPDALERYEESTALLDRTGREVSKMTVECNIAEIQLEQGRLDDAVARLSRARRAVAAIGEADIEALILRHLGRARGRQRDPESLGLLDAAETSFRTLGMSDSAVAVAGDRAEALLVLGDATEAASEAARVLKETETSHILRVLAASRSQLGDRDAALDAARRSVEVARVSGSRLDVALSLDVLARLEGTSPPPALKETFEAMGIVEPMRLPL